MTSVDLTQSLKKRQPSGRTGEDELELSNSEFLSID